MISTKNRLLRYRAFQKIDTKTPTKKLNWAASAVFLLINNHCDKGNTYLCLGECFMGLLGVFHKYFEVASRAFPEGLKCI